MSAGTRELPARPWAKMGPGPVAGLILLLAGIAFPLVVTNGTATQIGVDTMLFLGAAVSWNIFSGFTGYISLGHAVFFGTGAYAVAIAAQDWHLTESALALVPVAGLVAGVVAVPFGLIALRVRRHTFVVITIAIFFIFQLMAFNFSFTGGSVGIAAPFFTWDPVTFNRNFFYLAGAVALVAMVLAWLIRGSRFGLQLRAIRDDEDRVRGLGVRVMRVKLAAFVISAVLTGMVGAIWFFFINQVIPQYGFDPLFDLTVALMGFIGGFGTLWGPVLGALVLEPGQQLLSLNLHNAYAGEMIWGALFLMVILFLPRGVLPIAQEKLTARRARRQRGAGSGAHASGGTPLPREPLAAAGDTGAPATGGGAR